MLLTPSARASVQRALGFVFFLAALFSIQAQTAHPTAAGAFRDLLRGPDGVAVVTETATNNLVSAGHGVWRADNLEVSARETHNLLRVDLKAPQTPVKRVELRWRAALPADGQYLGDAWERAYGDLQWKPLDPARIMPWYFLATDGRVTHAYGVQTGPAAMCYWTASESNIILHADVRCGGAGVQLGSRVLRVCDVVCRRGEPLETPFSADRAFCQLMCPKPRLPREPVYGFNDWYCSYGHDTSAEFFSNVAFVISLSPPGRNRPFAVVDDGWQAKGEHGRSPGLWDAVNPKFSPSLTMPEFARQLKNLGARPGLWCRPLIANADAPAGWRLSRDHHFLDPSVPAVREHIRAMIARFHRWGFDLVKHDYSTFDLFGRWGPEMGSEITTSGWAFADRSRTSAEIIRNFYQDIRQAAGPKTVIIGCNTISHLAAGVFEMQRIGDDTSGQEWSRTRKMGVNCMAFRLPQNGTFYAVDGDCAGQVSSNSVPWAKNSQWLDLLAHSGAPLFVSFPRQTVSPTQETALRAALAAAARPQPSAQPLDWLTTRTPEHWLLDGRNVHFSW